MRTFSEGKTRAQLAAELLERLRRGPGLDPIATGEPYTPARALELYRLWCGSWVIPQAEALLAADLNRKKGPK